MFRRGRRPPSLLVMLVIAYALWLPPAAGHHGPGTSGGGSSTQSGETLRPGRFALDVRVDDTEFEQVSDSDLLRRAERAGTFDVMRRTLLTTLTASYGLVEDLQVGGSIGYYHAVGAREVEVDEATGEPELADFDPDGITDLWLTAKYRILKGPSGSFAVFGGAKLPTGDSDVTNSAGERVEQSSTAGSGSYDGMLGVAYSRWLSERTTLDLSAQYTLRTEAEDFKVGDRVDAGVAVATRLTADARDYPQVTLFAEATLQYLAKNEEDGATDPNTGGTTVFLSPGLRLGFSEAVTLTLSPQFPVLQHVNGEQVEVRFRGVAGLTFSY